MRYVYKILKRLISMTDVQEQPDPMKPMLDSMIDRIVTSLSGKAKAFYELEFGFFDEVTSISGKLKPYIKKEMAKIKLEVGVYLPSNPDGTVVDIKRDSGRPLQSHAKAPFMATFKVRRERVEVDDGTGTGTTKTATEGSETAAQAAPASSAEAKGAAANLDEGEEVVREYDVWQSAIFKVGDDCRQDVLALQVIAMFKNAFWSVGLDLYLFPYRVTATAPGVSNPHESLRYGREGG
jgi:phosphatidylinositol 4-kinase